MTTLDYSVVIPVYNSAGSLLNLVARLADVFKKLQADYEIVLVDDGSPNPETWPTLEALTAQHRQVRALQHARNEGQHVAFLTGMRRATGRYVVTMDDDGEHWPENIPLLLAKKRHDVVMARSDRKKPWGQRLSSHIKMMVENALFGRVTPLYVTSFCVFTQQINQRMLAMRTAHPVLSALQLHATRDVVNVFVPAGSRQEARSNYTFRRRMKLFCALLYSAFTLRRGLTPLPVATLSRDSSQ